MKKITWILFFAGLILLIAGFILIVRSNKRSGKSVKGMTTGSLTIEKVIDGDTAIANDGRHIRFLGINTAEKGESYSIQAKELNVKLTLGKPIRLEFDQEQKDRYGRTLAYVFVGELFINEQIVEQGLAIRISCKKI